jgi:hypothetical protein
MLRNALCYIADNGNLGKREATVECNIFIAYVVEK